MQGSSQDINVHKLCRRGLVTVLTPPAPQEGPLTRRTATSRRGSGFDLSTCKELVEIHARLDYGLLGLIIATLKTVLSRKFRKLTVDIALPKIKPEDWAEFDKEIFVLAKRVCATAGNDALEVLIRRRMAPGGTQLSEIERVLPLVSLSARVSLRTCTSWESLRPLGRVSF